MFRAIVRVFLITLIAAVLVASAYVGGVAASRVWFPPPLSADGSAPSDWKSSIAVFWEAWNYVHQDFYKTQLDDDTLVDGSVGGMVDGLGDPFTVYIDAKHAALLRTTLQGAFEGIGATIELREGRATIFSIIKDSPAERAGLRADDIILQVNGTVIQNMDLTQVVTLIRGPKGTQVKLLIQRGKQEPFTVEITRDTIHTPSVEANMIEGTKIAYLQLNQFSATAPDEMRVALTELRAQNPTGLIFDLRNNPGGHVDASIDIVSQFIEADQPVLIVKDKNGNAEVPRSTPGGLATDIPMVALVNAGSASASEIVSGALKDYRRATLIGTKTFGKGEMQLQHTLSDQSQLNVTIAHFFSPNGNEINGVGISPDIEVKVTDDDIANKRDPQLDAAIQFLQKGK